MIKTLRTRPLIAAGVVVSALSTTLFITGCEGEEATPATSAAPDARYTTQGRVAMLRDPKSPASQFKIHHEAIPSFVDGQGKVVGMHSHPMDFPRVAEGIDISNLEVGQPVRFTFDVTWADTGPVWVITELERLPEDTRFSFDPPAEGEPEAAGQDHGG